MAELGVDQKAVVGFDTATADTVICAMRDGEVLHEAILGLAADGSPRHSTALLAEVERAAAACGGWEQVGRLAVGRGPGSFVGMRIGLATARGLATSTGITVVGVSTLDALGRAIREPTTRSGAPLPFMAGKRRTGSLAVLDARRGEVFATLYSPEGERVWGPLVSLPTALAARLAEISEPLRAAGSGAVRFRQELADRDVDIPEDADPLHRISARHICALAGTGGYGDDDSLDPIYLRPPDAQRWRERDTSQRAE